MLIRRIFTREDFKALEESGASPIFSTVDSGDVNDEQSNSQYVSKLIKLIPAESIGLFVTIDNIIKSTRANANPIPDTVSWITFIVLIGVTVFITYLTSNNKNLKIAYKQIIISTIAFIVWVFALGGPFLLCSWYRSEYGAIILPIYSVLAPLMYKKTLDDEKC